MKTLRVGREQRAAARDGGAVGVSTVSLARRLELEDNVLPFRRRAGVRRSRRSLVRQWFRPFLGALLIVAVPFGTVAWIMTSPRFAVSEIAVGPGERVSEAWVRESLRPLLGDNLPLLSLERAERLLRRHPWVKSAGLRKDLPARLVVRIEEKQAVALLREGPDLFYLDASGTRIEPFDPLAGHADLLLVSFAGADAPTSVEPSAEAAGLRSAVLLIEEVEEVAPFWAHGLSEIEVLGERDFRVHTTSLAFPLLVRAGTLHQKARRLEELLPLFVERFGAPNAVDLRFARRIIVQPSAPLGDRPRSSKPADYREAT